MTELSENENKSCLLVSNVASMILAISHLYAAMLHSLTYVLDTKDRFSYWFVLNSRSPVQFHSL